MLTERFLADEAILQEIGRRLARRRMDLGHTQAHLAQESGVSKRTVERLEAGRSTQFLNVIRILRVLGWLDRVDRVFPEARPNPMDLLRLKGKSRQRAPRQRRRDTNTRWSWGDEQ